MSGSLESLDAWQSESSDVWQPGVPRYLVVWSPWISGRIEDYGFLDHGFLGHNISAKKQYRITIELRESGLNNTMILDLWTSEYSHRLDGSRTINFEKDVNYLRELSKGPVQSSNTNAEGMQSGAVYIIIFCIVLPSYVYLYTQFQKPSGPGRMLNFTEIHR